MSAQGHPSVPDITTVSDDQGVQKQSEVEKDDQCWLSELVTQFHYSSEPAPDPNPDQGDNQPDSRVSDSLAGYSDPTTVLMYMVQCCETELKCLSAVLLEGSTGTEVVLGRPSLYRSSRNAGVGFEPRTFRASANLLTERSVVRTRPPPLNFPCLGLDNLAVTQSSCSPRVAWQLGTERVLQVNDQHSRAFCDQSWRGPRNGRWYGIHRSTRPDAVFSVSRFLSSQDPWTVRLDFKPPKIGARYGHWLERESTVRNVCDSDPASASRLLLFRLGQPGSTSALVLPLGCVAARHIKGCYS
ncbi:hypothetical protein CSKR_109692 [Clonorchis sinensis]|uniref:Uncharacterized protein n=1 Tax=Clonorchis sinensis TaxID=79923 RepID=A0A3R7EMN8_CLOSI|nr:hypothetical protein CSKR_109692 [Clonorchis sinensis]